jgi:hypothetical protein
MLTAEGWLTTLRACPQLTHIHVSRQAVPNFVVALGRISASSQHVCPRLLHVTLAKIKLHIEVDGRELVTYFTDYIQARFSSNVPLRRVAFEKCFYSSPDAVVNNLRRRVSRGVKFNACDEEELNEPVEDDY